MPKSLENYIGGFASKKLRNEMSGTCWKRYMAGEPWAHIEQELKREEEPPSGPASPET